MASMTRPIHGAPRTAYHTVQNVRRIPSPRLVAPCWSLTFVRGRRSLLFAPLLYLIGPSRIFDPRPSRKLLPAHPLRSISASNASCRSGVVLIRPRESCLMIPSVSPFVGVIDFLSYDTYIPLNQWVPIYSLTDFLSELQHYPQLRYRHGLAPLAYFGQEAVAESALQREASDYVGRDTIE
jgi:hypothetical protein